MDEKKMEEGNSAQPYFNKSSELGSFVVAK
jgi:hypothetical protein